MQAPSFVLCAISKQHEVLITALLQNNPKRLYKEILEDFIIIVVTIISVSTLTWKKIKIGSFVRLAHSSALQLTVQKSSKLLSAVLWLVTCNGKHLPAHYLTAWRHILTIFKREPCDPWLENTTRRQTRQQWKGHLQQCLPQLWVNCLLPPEYLHLELVEAMEPHLLVS